MCGIVGYIGKRCSLPVLIDGLKRLEYRGYDHFMLKEIHEQPRNLAKSVTVEQVVLQGSGEGLF